MSYNGWTNYETWNVALWIDNEEGTYHEAREKTQAAYDATDEDLSHEERCQEAARDLSNELEEWVKETMLPDLGASFAADLLGAAVSEINWYELAEHWLSEVDEPEKEAEEA